MADERKSKIKSLKLDSKSKTGKILIFLLVILVLSLSAYLYKQKATKPIEEPEVFIPLDSTKEEYLVEEEEKIIEPKDEIIEIKDDLEEEFSLKSEFELEILNENKGNNFDEFESSEQVKVPKDKFEKAEMELDTLVKEFREKEGFTDKSDEEIWKKSKDAFDELDAEVDKLEK